MWVRDHFEFESSGFKALNLYEMEREACCWRWTLKYLKSEREKQKYLCESHYMRLPVWYNFLVVRSNRVLAFTASYRGWSFLLSFLLSCYPLSVRCKTLELFWTWNLPVLQSSSQASQSQLCNPMKKRKEMVHFQWSAPSLIFKLQQLRVIIFHVKFLRLPCFWYSLRHGFDSSMLWLWM